MGADGKSLSSVFGTLVGTTADGQYIFETTEVVQAMTSAIYTLNNSVSGGTRTSGSMADGFQSASTNLNFAYSQSIHSLDPHYKVSMVPEPATMIAVGLGALALLRKGKRRSENHNLGTIIIACPFM